ncbi:MAG TPA: ABC transporter permease [Acidimicrobiales bacterium]|nr:ABC transporter permease [Acidimicrobiales bacterium]
MSLRRTLLTTKRILEQLRHDPRTLALLLLVPAALVGLLSWSLTNQPGAFDSVGPKLLGVFPLIVMFLVTSVITLRERTVGTLERLFTLPLTKADFVAGYAIAFGALALVQSVLVSVLSYTWYGLAHQGVPWRISIVALCAGLLGTAFGLALSAVAHTEFQAVQFMPAFILPQLLLCGLVIPVSQLPSVLRAIADVLPMTAAVHAITPQQSDSYYLGQFAIMLAYIFAALVVGGGTLRRVSK